MKFLLIEDDEKIAAHLAKGIVDAGYEVSIASDGLAGLEQVNATTYQVVILDLMLPKIDGLTVLAEIRKIDLNIPVIILSAKETIDDKIRGLQSGADDYMTKPFSIHELLARVHALLRRGKLSEKSLTIKHDNLSVDLVSRYVERNGKEIVLHAKEYLLLEFLLQNRGKIITKPQILKQVWGYDFDPQTNIVDALICRLRNKIDKGFENRIIETIRGVGYAIKGK